MECCLTHLEFFSGSVKWSSNEVIVWCVYELCVYCYRLKACVPPKFIRWNRIPTVMALASEASGRWLGYSPRKWDQCPYKKDPRSSLPPSTMWGHSEKIRHLWTRKWRVTGRQCAAPWSWISQPLELWEINVCYLSLCEGLNVLCGFLLQQPKWTKTFMKSKAHWYFLFQWARLPSRSPPKLQPLLVLSNLWLPLNFPNLLSLRHSLAPQHLVHVLST